MYHNRPVARKSGWEGDYITKTVELNVWGAS